MKPKKENKIKSTKKKQNTPPKEHILTKSEFLKILDTVIQPVPSPKQTKKGKTGTSA